MTAHNKEVFLTALIATFVAKVVGPFVLAALPRRT